MDGNWEGSPKRLPREQRAFLYLRGQVVKIQQAHLGRPPGSLTPVPHAAGEGDRKLTAEEEEARRIAEMGKPVLGENCRLEVIIEESYDFKVICWGRTFLESGLGGFHGEGSGKGGATAILQGSVSTTDSGTPLPCLLVQQGCGGLWRWRTETRGESPVPLPLAEPPRCSRAVMALPPSRPQNTVDKLIKKTNLALVIGTHSWREQFLEAVTVSAGEWTGREGRGAETESRGEPAEGERDRGTWKRNDRNWSQRGRLEKIREVWRDRTGTGETDTGNQRRRETGSLRPSGPCRRGEAREASPVPESQRGTQTGQRQRRPWRRLAGSGFGFGPRGFMAASWW